METFGHGEHDSDETDYIESLIPNDVPMLAVSLETYLLRSCSEVHIYESTTQIAIQYIPKEGNTAQYVKEEILRIRSFCRDVYAA